MHAEINEAIKERIAAYEAHIDEYWGSLNTEGVWLFLATLGCWSVSHAPSQLLAIAITFILFTQRIYSKLSDKRSFPAIAKEIKKSIRTELEEGDTMKARLHDLNQLRSVKLSLVNSVKSSATFLLCYCFAVVTLWYWWINHG